PKEGIFAGLPIHTRSLVEGKLQKRSWPRSGSESSVGDAMIHRDQFQDRFFDGFLIVTADGVQFRLFSVFYYFVRHSEPFNVGLIAIICSEFEDGATHSPL